MDKGYQYSSVYWQKGQHKSQEWNPSSKSHIPPASQQGLRALKITPCTKNIHAASALHESTCRWASSYGRGATAITQWDLSTLVMERSQLSGTSRRVVMLMVMDAPRADSGLRSSGVVCVCVGGGAELRNTSLSHNDLSVYWEKWSVFKRRRLVNLSSVSMNATASESITYWRPEGGGRWGFKRQDIWHRNSQWRQICTISVWYHALKVEIKPLYSRQTLILGIVCAAGLTLTTWRDADILCFYQP